MKPILILAGLLALAAAAGCSSGAPAAPDVPAALRVPSGQVPMLEAFGTGSQVYECAAGASGGWGWRFEGPEATLSDRSGRVIGKHYAGPTWEAGDGSRVVGHVLAQDPGPDPKDIPWLLLEAKSNSGPGIMAAVRSVQRLHTVGGAAPATPCTAEKAGAVARVPYSATYEFYRAAR